MADESGDCFSNTLCCAAQVSRLLEFLSYVSKRGIASTSTSGRGQKKGWNGVVVERPWLGCPVYLLAEQEFWDHFRISNVISILLVDEKPTPIEKLSHNATYFSKEQFNVGLCFPLPSLLKQFFHFTKIPPAFLHPNVVRVLMGCSVLDMLYHLDLSLLEIVFVYTIKMSQKERFNLSAHISS